MALETPSLKVIRHLLTKKLNSVQIHLLCVNPCVPSLLPQKQKRIKDLQALS